MCSVDFEPHRYMRCSTWLNELAAWINIWQPVCNGRNWRIFGHLKNVLEIGTLFECLSDLTRVYLKRPSEFCFFTFYFDAYTNVIRRDTRRNQKAPFGSASHGFWCFAHPLNFFLPRLRRPPGAFICASFRYICCAFIGNDRRVPSLYVCWYCEIRWLLFPLHCGDVFENREVREYRGIHWDVLGTRWSTVLNLGERDHP